MEIILKVNRFVIKLVRKPFAHFQQLLGGVEHVLRGITITPKQWNAMCSIGEGVVRTEIILNQQKRAKKCVPK
jgi:hypothetical protein